MILKGALLKFQLKQFINEAFKASEQNPILIDKFIAKVLDKIPVNNLTQDDIPMLTEKAYSIIRQEIENDPEGSALEAINKWKEILY